MRRSSRLLLVVISVFLCVALIMLSVSGVLSPVQGILATPLQFLQGLANSFVTRVSNFAEGIVELQSLQQRNRELEAALAAYQSEIVELREIRSDYDRIAAFLKYTRSRENEEFLVADVIGRDISAFNRVIQINRGTRDGLREGMPVVTEDGLVGRISRVSANASQVTLITDTVSSVNARLLSSRAEGAVQGQVGGLRMTFIDLGTRVQEGDTVITSGLGGNFPEGIIIGQVTSVRQAESELFREAEVRSLNNFDRLENVMVITNFQPVDLSVFE